MIRHGLCVFGILLAAVLLVIVPAQAAILYVDNTRACPGNGSSGTPFCSIHNAINAAAAGDTVRIRTGSGIYSETASVDARNGTASNPIIIEPDDGARFIIRNSGNGSSAASLRITNGDHWIVRNLTFDANGVTPSLFAVNFSCGTKSCVGLKFLNNTIRNWRRVPGGSIGPSTLAISADWQNNRTITVEVGNNLFENIDRQAIGLTGNLGTVIRDNEIRNIRCGKGDDGAANALGMHIIFNNRQLQIYDNHIHSFVSKADCGVSPALHATTAGIWCDVNGGVDSQSHIHRNVIHGMDKGDATTSMPNGSSHGSQGIFIEQGCAGFHVYRNLVYDIGNYGIRNSYHSLNANQPLNRYYNNTIFNVRGFGFWIREGRAELKNNVFRTPNGSIVAYIEIWSTSLVQLFADYNLYDDNGGQAKVGRWGSGDSTRTLSSWSSVCRCDQNSISANPQFFNESSADFHLTTSSPARNRGEGGIDMGAYSYVAGQLPNAPTILQVAPN